VFLGAGFLWDSGSSVSTRSLHTLFLAGRSFLVARSIRSFGSFLATYALNSLKRHKKRMRVYKSPTFLVKVVLILPSVRTHSENVTHQISLGKGHFHGNHGPLHAWDVYQQGSCKMQELS
jgi:hypothetical protein